MGGIIASIIYGIVYGINVGKARVIANHDETASFAFGEFILVAVGGSFGSYLLAPLLYAFSDLVEFAKGIYCHTSEINKKLKFQI